MFNQQLDTFSHVSCLPLLLFLLNFLQIDKSRWNYSSYQQKFVRYTLSGQSARWCVFCADADDAYRL